MDNNGLFHSEILNQWLIRYKIWSGNYKDWCKNCKIVSRNNCFEFSNSYILLTWLGIINWLIGLGPNLFNDLYTVICVTIAMMAIAIDETVKRCRLHPFNSGVKKFKSSKLQFRVIFLILVDILLTKLDWRLSAGFSFFNYSK